MNERRFQRQARSAREIELLVSGRVPPHDLDAEAACISAALLYADARSKLRDVLDPSACYSDANKTILEALFDLDARGVPADLVTAKDELRARGVLERVGGMPYLAMLADASPAVANVLAHAAVVTAHHQARLALTTFWRLLAEGYQGPRDVRRWLEGAAADVTALAEANGERSGGTLSQGLAESHAKLVEDQRGAGMITGLPTGFAELDARTGGLEVPDVLLVCGVEGRGKSTLAHCMALHVASTPAIVIDAAEEQRVPRGVVIFSIDNMDRKLVAHRMACARARVDSRVFRTGSATSQDWDRLTSAEVELEGLPIHIEDDTALTPLRMRSKLRQAKASLRKAFGAELVLVVLDYVQLMKLDGDVEHLSTEQKLNAVGKQLMRIARDFNVALMVVSQINNDGTTAHARSLQQDAQCKITVDWKKSKPRVFVPGVDPNKHPCHATISVEKWRNGPTGIVHTNFYPAYTLFTDEVL